jgi:hypothetical protein
VSDPNPDAPSSDVADVAEVAADEVELHDGPPAELTPAPAAGAAPEPALTATPVSVAPLETGYTSEGVPTFDYAREKIETRYGTALGASELAAETPEGRSVEEQYEARQRAAAEKLEEIRASMRNEPGQA